jgi:DNA integrity scanning protein DisA with diadenylate cyclase activity
VIAPWVLAGLASFMAAFAMWLVGRAARRIDNLEQEQARLKERIHEIEIKSLRELATKEDVHEIKRYVESIASTVGEVRDMVIRMEASGGKAS